MNKRLWINIGLLAFIILLCVILLNTETDTTKKLPHLSTIDHLDIVQIKVLRKDKENFIFNKKNEVWYMDAPQKFRANIARINAMLRLLNMESYSQLNPAEIELKTIGLNDPAAIIKLNDHEFIFGDTDAIDKRRYVLFDGKIHLTNDTIYHQLFTDMSFFADTKLFPKNTKINSIQFPKNKLELIDGHWKLQTLLDIKPDQLKRVAFSWQSAAAVSVDKYSEPTSVIPEEMIKITTIDNISIHFVVVATEPHLILGRKDLGFQYHMGSDETAKLFPSGNSEKVEQAETLKTE